MMIEYAILIRKNGHPALGLKPTWSAFRELGTGAQRINDAPPINELGDGLYGYHWDAIQGAECVGIIDAGPEITDLNERFTEQRLDAAYSKLFSIPSF